MPDAARPSGSTAVAAIREHLRRGDSYGVLLALVMATYVLMAVLDRGLWSRVALTVALGCVLLLALHTSKMRPRMLRVAAVLVLVAFVEVFLQALFDRNGTEGSTYIICVLVLAAPLVILNRILRHPVIGLETIFGAVCVYVLLGILFSGIYSGIDSMAAHGFFRQHAAPSHIDFLYFSFVTLTTLGYGDLTPGTDAGKVLVTFEALVGQVFLVTLVARLVALYGLERPRRERDHRAG